MGTIYCLSNEKFERLSGPPDEIMLFCTASTTMARHKDVVDMTLFTMTSFDRHVANTLWLLRSFIRCLIGLILVAMDSLDDRGICGSHGNS